MDNTVACLLGMAAGAALTTACGIIRSGLLVKRTQSLAEFYQTCLTEVTERYKTCLNDVSRVKMFTLRAEGQPVDKPTPLPEEAMAAKIQSLRRLAGLSGAAPLENVPRPGATFKVGS